MSEDLSDLINNVKNIVDSGNIPDNMKEILNKLNSSENNTIVGNSKSNSGNITNNLNNLNIDIDTVLKMKSIIDNINQNDDPRSNLLYSLKPYLRESRKSKLDQYVNLLNITKIVGLINNEKKENNGNV